MPTILVVDDSEVDRRIAAGLLEKHGLHTIKFAGDGREALRVIQESIPDLVLTDMQMPERDGLGLVNAIRVHYPQVPVVLMTAHGSDRLAMEALESGAASYVPKSQLADKLMDTVDEVLAIARADRTYERLISCLSRTEFTFVLENDPQLVDPLVDFVQQIVAGVRLCDANGRFRIGVALKSALLNALYRGNLEIGFHQTQQMREDLISGREGNLVEERRRMPPYSDRRINVELIINKDEARFVIRDDGPGFELSKIPDPGETGSLEPTSGRGLVLMRAFMDEVQFNQKGNEVTMIKRQEAAVKDEV